MLTLSPLLLGLCIGPGPDRAGPTEARVGADRGPDRTGQCPNRTDKDRPPSYIRDLLASFLEIFEREDIQSLQTWIGDEQDPHNHSKFQTVQNPLLPENPIPSFLGRESQEPPTP